MVNPFYESVGLALVDRIEALVPRHPEILTFKSPWDLFNIPGFSCNDLGPTFGQANAALAIVQRRHMKVGAE